MVKYAQAWQANPKEDLRMISCLSRDYENTQAMTFGEAPEFQDILDLNVRIEDALNVEGAKTIDV